MSDEPRITEADLADIAALADGSMPADRREDVRERIATSPELTAELARQTRATELVAHAQRQVSAPAGLRARVGAERTRRRPLVSPRRLGFATGGIAVAVAAVILALFVIPSGVTGGTLLAEAAATHARASERPAPPPRNAALLDLERFGVMFPNWTGEFEWTAVGARDDRVRGRDVATVTYRKGDATLGYSVISGDRVDAPGSARALIRDGVPLRVFRDGDRTIVVFDRGSRTCVVSGVGVPEDTLTKLAAWKGSGALRF